MPLRSALALSALGSGAAASIQKLCTNHSAVDVETMVFSGTPNPVFTLDGSDWQEICSILQQSGEMVSLPTCRVLGFTGWKLCPSHSASECVVLRGNPIIDLPLFIALSRHLPDLPIAIFDHIKDELARLHQSNGGDTQCAHEGHLPFPSNAVCNGPVVGPDDPKQVHYDPSHDDQGCFIAKAYANNCYDYGTDIATNTFAQPGRGSGVCPPHARPCVKNTCEDVKNAAISDGLTWVGTELPSSLPDVGHYVSLHIWPNSNFHWIRMDADMYWSHKPGGTQVRNVDNRGAKITNPGKADFSPWTEHCGYMLSIPSRGKITSMSTASEVQV